MNRGLTLVETLVGSAVFILVALAGYKAFGTLMDAVSISQAKVSATAVANERFEIIRNLPYTDVGIVAGVPAGKIPRNQAVVRDGYSFNVQTTIRNVDDPFDGTIGGAPNDSSPADYKSADLDITCTNCKTLAPLKFTTLIAPRALETASTNGALFVQVFDADGLPVPGASVHIVNNQTNPSTIIDEITDNLGWVKIIDAPPGTNAYNLTATKTGYSQDQTYPIGGSAGPNPNNPDATVVLQQITQSALSIDTLASVLVESVDTNCTAWPNLGFSLTGTKLVGAPNYLKYPAQSFSTDDAGIKLLSNLEWDTYSALLTSGTLDLAGSSLFSTFALAPGDNKTLRLVVTPRNAGAVLVEVKDQNGNALDGATVRLQKTGFDETKNTNSGVCPMSGQVFWGGLSSGTYTLTVTMAGFQNSVTSISVGSSWQSQNITLQP